MSSREEEGFDVELVETSSPILQGAQRMRELYPCGAQIELKHVQSRDSSSGEWVGWDPAVVVEVVEDGVKVAGEFGETFVSVAEWPILLRYPGMGGEEEEVGSEVGPSSSPRRVPTSMDRPPARDNSPPAASPPPNKFVFTLCSGGSNACPRWCSWFECLDGLNDAWTVSSSILDIVTDVLVSIEFYRHGHLGFFWSSVAIFVAAQLAYAFLFTGTWASDHSIPGKLCVFAAVLPLGQLIPIFAWLESFRFEAVDACLEAFSLTPTSGSGAAKKGSAAAAAASAAPVDGLWSFIQKKYRAHAGFLAEAFVEAIPQGILQLIAVLSLSDSSGVNVLSILMSVSVVASKGYLVAFSLHRPTLVFNFLMISADAFNLFAAATWLFVRIGNDNDDGNDSNENDDGGGKLPNPFETHPYYAWPLLLGLASGAVGTFFAVVFMVCDDHLKQLYPVVYKGGVLGDGESVFFDLYVVRLVAWSLSLLPLAVVYATAKLSLIPVLVFQSLDPEQAIHATFYRPLFQFVNGFVGRDFVSSPRTTTSLPSSAQTASSSTSSSSTLPELSPFSSSLSSSSSTNVHPLLHAQHFRDNTKLGALDRQLRLHVTNRFLLELQIHAKEFNLDQDSQYADSTVLEFVKQWWRKLDTTDSTLTPEDLEARNRKAAEAILARQRARAGLAPHTQQPSDLHMITAANNGVLAGAEQDELETLRAAAERLGVSSLNARSEILRHFFFQTIQQKPINDSNRQAAAVASPTTTGATTTRTTMTTIGISSKVYGCVVSLMDRCAKHCCCSGFGGGGVGRQLAKEAQLSWNAWDVRWWLQKEERFVYKSSDWLAKHPLRVGWSITYDLKFDHVEEVVVGFDQQLVTRRGVGREEESGGRVGFAVGDAVHGHFRQEGAGWGELKPAVITGVALRRDVPDDHYQEGRAASLALRRLVGDHEGFKRQRVSALRLAVRLVGLLSLLGGALSACVFLPSTLAFAVVSVLFPATQLPQCFNANNDSNDEDDTAILLLPCVMSWGYLTCLVVLCCLAPSVWQFQKVRSRVRDAKGFPECFYGPEAVAEIYARYAASLGRVEAMRMVHSKVGRFNALSVFSYLEESSRGNAYT